MHSPLPSFENHLPRRVITGRGASQFLAALCQTNGWNRVFVVSDAGVAGAGLLRQVALPLRAETFAEVPPEPPIDVVDTIAARIKASGAQAVDLDSELGGHRLAQIGF
jgi:alcohol dehydrogenase class IV